MLADDPTNKLEPKTFHCQIQNDHDTISSEELTYQDIPAACPLNQNGVLLNYQHIKKRCKNNS